MTIQLLVTFAVLIFMAVSFMSRKISYGMTAMICMAVLAVTNVVDLNTAFSGFSNKITVLVATMMLIAGCIGKTGLVHRIRQRMVVIQKQNGIMLLAALFLFTIALTQLIGMTALMSIMLLIITTLDDESELSQSRAFFLIAAINAAWFGRIPIGMGATLPMIQNSYYEGLVNANPEYLLGIFDYLRVGIIPSIVLTLYCLFAWRLIPRTKINADAMQTAAAKEDVSSLTPTQEKLVWGIFVVVMLAFVFSSKLGNLVYILPIFGCILLVLTGIVHPREASMTLAGDMIFCVAGVLVVSAALSSSGAGELIGKFVLTLLGNEPSGLLVTTVFCLVTAVMTNFLSNNGTVAIMTPIAVSTALAGGMNPKAVVLVVYCASCLAIGFPTGCAASTMAYAIGNHNPIRLLKFTLPYLALGCASLIVSAMLFYPIYG
ncbi:MAG: SLC13 family permease [Oribacterium sp.]